MSGVFPDISGLNVLDVLQIRENEFTGTLPSGMNALTKYDATSNSFNNDIPNGISSMTNLEELLL
jgi:hypothetical protein